MPLSLKKHRAVPTRWAGFALNPNQTRRVIFGRNERRITQGPHGRVTTGLVPLKIVAPHLIGAEQTIGYACPRCGTVFALSQYRGHGPDVDAYVQTLARNCCNCKCSACGSSVGKQRTICDDCHNRNYSLGRRKWAKRAKLVGMDDCEDGWFYADGYGDNDGYFDDIQTLIDWCGDEGHEELPSYIHPCIRVTASIDLDTILERLDEEYEGEDSVTDQFPDVTALAKAIDDFNAALLDDGPRLYQADFRRVIILDADRFNDEFGTDQRDGTPIMSWADRPPSVSPIDVKTWIKAIRGETTT